MVPLFFIVSADRSPLFVKVDDHVSVIPVWLTRDAAQARLQKLTLGGGYSVADFDVQVFTDAVRWHRDCSRRLFLHLHTDTDDNAA